MSKFEVKNGLWIEKTEFGKWENDCHYEFIKISEIKRMVAIHVPRSYDNIESYRISLDISGGISMTFFYSAEESFGYKADLELLKNILKLNDS